METTKKTIIDNSSGFIKLHRSMLDWEWYDDNNTFKLFIHCLFKANFKDKKWHGIVIKRGSFITSLNGLSKQTKLSISKLRTSLLNLISTNEIIKKSDSLKTIIIVVNYEKYQKNDKVNRKASDTVDDILFIDDKDTIHDIVNDKAFDKQNHKRIANESQQLKKDKNVKKGNNNINIITKEKYLDFVYLTKKQYEDLVKDFGEATIKSWIEELDNYIADFKPKYKSHSHTIRRWIRKEAKKNQSNITSKTNNPFGKLAIKKAMEEKNNGGLLE